MMRAACATGLSANKTNSPSSGNAFSKPAATKPALLPGLTPFRSYYQSSAPSQLLSVCASAAGASSGLGDNVLGRGIDSLSAAKTQSYVIGKDGKSVTVPLGAVQQLPESVQSVIFVSIFVALAVCTYLNVTVVGPALAAAAPAVHAWLLWARVPLCSALFFVVGVAHFTAHEGIASMYPKPGAWGLWHLPGSAAFHVNWTGVAEIAGALGLALGAAAIPTLQALYPQLQAASAAGLFLLTIAVSPANVYMYTHNAPGPVGTVVPWPLHVWRFYMQVALLTAFWDMGHGVLLGRIPLLP